MMITWRGVVGVGEAHTVQHDTMCERILGNCSSVMDRKQFSSCAIESKEAKRCPRIKQQIGHETAIII